MYRTLTILLLILWGTRIAALDALPLHNDEGLHLTRAVEVWNLHPFWEIRDGKIVNHWLIAAFYPQNAPAFVGRIATVFVSMIGLASGYALARRYGARSALFAGLFWISSNYLFFYERLAFSDAEAGALVVLALWAAWHLAKAGRLRNAVLTGLCFGLALLFKFTAAPFALSVAIVVLAFARYPLAQRLRRLAVAALVVGLMFVVPVGYLLLRAENLFDIALGWVGSSGGSIPNFGKNITQLVDLLWNIENPILTLFLFVGTLNLILSRKEGLLHVLTASIPLLSILLLGREIMPRHFVVGLPLWLVLGGAGTGVYLTMLPSLPRTILAPGIIILLAAPFARFAWIAYTDPPTLALPAAVRAEHITDHSAGYGLREAVTDFPNTISPLDTPIVGSMFPDSCRRANFYAVNNITMICTDAPGIAQMEALLAEQETIYVLNDTAPLIGADMELVASQLNAQVTQIARYPRPGQTQESAAVVLWRVQRK